MGSEETREGGEGEASARDVSPFCVFGERRLVKTFGNCTARPDFRRILGLRACFSLTMAALQVRSEYDTVPRTLRTRNL